MKTISIANLLVMLLPLGAVAFFYAKWVGKTFEIAQATLRMVSQLLLMGYALTYIFEKNSSILATLVFIAMIIFSSLIALRNLEDRNWRLFAEIVLSIAVGGGIHLFLVVVMVLKLDPWYELKVVIPLAGMIFSSGMNAVSLGAERYKKELSLNGSHTEARNSSFKASLIPQINSFMAVGLVSLPGMMTGQILSGVSPLIAVRYQMMVMCMILGTAGLSLTIFFILRGLALRKN